MGLLMVICMWLLLLHARRKADARRSTWTEYVGVAAILGTLLMVAVYGIGAGAGGGGTQTTPGQVGAATGHAAAAAMRHASPFSLNLALILNVGSVLATLLFAAMALVLFLSLRAQRAEGADVVPDEADPLHGGPPLAALHRVRAAWREAEAALTLAGLARRPSQTPEEYAAALAQQLPGAANDLHTLTRLYLPVRYGGMLSDQDADTAEAAARQIRTHLSGLTRPPSAQPLASQEPA